MEKGKSTVVLAALNSKYIHSSLSVWYLAAGLRRYESSLDPIVYEATIHEKTALLFNSITAHGAFAVCFSCYIWNIEKTLEIAQMIKAEFPKTHIVLGGPEAEHRSEQLLRDYAFISCVSLGEGEESLPALLLALQNGTSLANLDGCAFLDGGKFYKKAARALLNEPPSPYTPEYLNRLNGRMAYIETARGCPYSCAFCLSGAGCAPKWFSLKRAENDILLLSNSGAQTVKFVDRTFNAKASHANAIWRFIVENYGKAIPHGVRFHFEIAADILSDESLEILKAMPRGAVQLEAGIQSVNEQTLAAVRRKTDTEKLLFNLRELLSLRNLHVHIDLIAGLPHENLQSFINGFNKVYELKADMLQLGFLKLLYGSAMRNEPQSYPCEFSKKPPYEIISTPWLSPGDIELARRVEDSLERIYNSRRFLLTAEYIISTSKLSPFEVFSSISAMPHKTSLSDYAAHMLSSFSLLPNIDKAVLRDKMAQDWLSFNSTGRLPPALCVADEGLKKFVKALSKNKSTAPKAGVRRGAALLYSENCGVYADYENADEISGHFLLKRVKLSELGL